uniref:Insulin-like domain-containing protein n=1 Tax=Panagrolaimus sp. PS1159 TaxID=55785 RepID=A0AC35GRQ6_9BILA
MLLIFISVFSFGIVYSSPAVKIHTCGDDLKYLINYICTYPDKKLPCFSHFLNNTVNNEENPLHIIDAMKQKQLQNEFDDVVHPSTPSPLFQKSFTVIENCCHFGCSVIEVKKKYCCFTQKCLDLCYPEKFDVFL